MCVREKVKQEERKGGLVSFINPEISIKSAKSEASCVIVNQHKKYLLCGSNFLKHTALWQSPYESFWHIIIHLLKDHFVYKNHHTHTANSRFYGTHIFKSIERTSSISLLAQGCSFYSNQYCPVHFCGIQDMVLLLFIMKLEMRTFIDFYSISSIYTQKCPKRGVLCLYFAYFIFCTQQDFF